jgi:predicted phosphoribosyltransferase
VICLEAPEMFMAIGQFYVEFSQLSDEAVRELLAEAWSITAGPSLRRGRVDGSG